MLGEGDVDLPLPVPVPSSLCPHRSSQDAGLPHHHTVHLGSTQAPCMHCSRRKRRPLHRQGRSKEGKGKMHPGETTVFSVGRFHVTHIGKKLASHESQEEHESKQDLGSADLEHSHEKSQSEGSQNGIIHPDGLQQGHCPEAVPPSERIPAEEGAEEPERPLDVAANSDVRVDGPEKKECPEGSAWEEAGLRDPATRNGSQTSPCTGPKRPGETERLNTAAEPSEKESTPRAAEEGSESKGSPLLHAGSRLDLSRKDITRTSSTESQGRSRGAQDPGASV
ncbi:RELT-like protein 2 [Varanus komodoensis]|uniref:RELT-like protein 2 n=1 Tax=Varanus komodoensis TaxID=61221 RepID=UPI001CF76DF3|nr:RELT-like protein 2 [Varanus komodoensis]